MSRAGPAELAAGQITVVRAPHVQLDVAVDCSPVDAWDLKIIAGRYENFIQRSTRLVPRITAGAVTGGKAVRARAEMMGTYRHFPSIGPVFRVKLMPP